MAPVGRAGVPQLLRGTGKQRWPVPVPAPGAGLLVAYYSPPEPETQNQLDPDARLGAALASSTGCAPSFPRCSLRRYSSEIRTGCANERPSGSVRGVPGTLVSLPRSPTMPIQVRRCCCYTHSRHEDPSRVVHVPCVDSCSSASCTRFRTNRPEQGSVG